MISFKPEFQNKMSLGTKKQQNDPCGHASAQSDQTLRCVLYGYLRTLGFSMWTVKTDQTGQMTRLI